MKKQRLDQFLMGRYPQESRSLLQSLIMQGKVTVNDVVVTKPGAQVTEGAVIEVDFKTPQYVSRAGFKLEKALKEFGIDVAGLTVMDAGISTGGFTDCLLQHGAAKVYGIDVGYGQVHEKIAKDPGVEVHERTNLRHLERLPELVDLITLDLSFISVLKVMDTVVRLLKPDGQLIVLIKPQFEAEKAQIGRGGIIKDSAIHQAIIEKVTQGICAHGFELVGVTESPISGAAGNKEFLAYFRRIDEQ